MAENVSETPADGAGEDILGDIGEEETPKPEETPNLDDVEEIVKEDEPAEEVKEEDKETPEGEEEEKPKEKLSERDENIVKRLNAKDKTILKEFPEVRSALFRDREFTKVFPTPDDAKEAADAVDTLEYFEDSVRKGNPEVLIENIASLDKDGKALETFALNFIPALQKKNSEVYNKVVDPLARNLLATAFNTGKKTGQKNIWLAAQHLHAFYFDGDANPKGAKLGVEDQPNPERDALIAERQTNFMTSVQTSAKQGMAAKIEAKLPKGVSETLKAAIIDKTLKDIGAKLNKDEVYSRQRDSLVRKAARMNYAGDWGTRITSLYTGQATKLLPAALGNALKEFLPSNSAQPNPKPNQGVKPTSGGNSAKDGKPAQLDGRKVDWKKTTPEKFLDD